jgi:murein DD-endopeptidase MepM/ murein hydrolase activator NlpD
MVAAATGAFVAAGQTVVTPLLEAAQATEAAPPVAVATLVPVAETTGTTTVLAAGAIGGAQLLPASLDGLDPGNDVDLQNLTKAVEIGEELARREAVLDAAQADGAPLAGLYGDAVYVQPAEGRFTSGFGARWGRSHNGIDVAAPIGTPIYALTAGVVEEAGAASGFGQWVVLRHEDGTKTVYGHVNRFFVREGQEVDAGERIAEVGNRGFSTGPHLHFEVYDEDDAPLDPRPYLQKRGVFGY